MNAYYDARIKGRTTDRGVREKGSLKSNKIKLGGPYGLFFLLFNKVNKRERGL